MSNGINLKESTTISINNADGSSISISSDDINELTQIMKNAGLTMPTQYTNDVAIDTDGDICVDDEIETTSDEYYDSDQSIDYIDSEIPSYDLVSDEDDYYFDLGDTGYDIDYEDPYGDLSDIVGYVEEVAELSASVPYDEDAEESGFNIKGTAHQSNLRYVPGMASDNPMVDELREGLDNEFENELNDAISYCRDEMDESDMLDSLELGRSGPIDIRVKQILISNLANYLYTRYVKDITNGNSRLTPNNFEGIASSIFEDNLWHILQGEGFYWTSNSD